MSLWCLLALHPAANEENKLYAVVSAGSILVILFSACLGRYCLQLLAEQWRSLKKNQTFIEQLQGPKDLGSFEGIKTCAFYFFPMNFRIIFLYEAESNCFAVRVLG